MKMGAKEWLQRNARIRTGKNTLFTEPKIHWSAITLATWLAATALTHYPQNIPMVISDLASAITIAVMASLALRRKDPHFDTGVQWVSALIAAWLMFAPLVFWTKSPVAYMTDNLAATLLVLCYWIIPHARDTSSDIAQTPPGWDYNPSDWWQRVPLMALALIGYFIARYLACAQLGYTGPAWDPVFHDGTEKILHSDVSKAFIISDAGLGAVSYLIDALACIIGNRARWQTMPWMVLLFSFLVIPPGVVSIVLVILQPVAVGNWCFLCLVAAFNMLFMVPFALDETVATCQYLQRAKQAGHGYLKTACLGTKLYADRIDSGKINESENQITSSEVVPPLGLVVSMFVSASVLAVPHFFAVTGPAAINCYVVGALCMTFSVMAFAEVCRTLRLINPLLCTWLLASIIFLPGYTNMSASTLCVAAIVISVCSLRKGKIMHRYGSFNKFIH
jgi:hypothetical protein